MSRLTTLAGLLFVVTFSLFADLEIVVTASRVEEEARNAPSYVRVIPEEDIAQGNTVIDVLQSLPDLNVISTSPGKEQVSLGGFGENGFGRTLILIDGRPVNRADMATINWRSIPLDRVERIEVVKGALSSQYGDQAVAGAINIITKDPEDFEFWVKGDFSSDTTNRQALGMAYGSDSIRVEGGVSREDLNPVRDRSDSNVVAVNAGIGTTLGSTAIDLSGQASESFFQLPGSLTKVQFDADPNQSVNPSDEVRERVYILDLSVGSNPGTLSLDGSASWKRLDSRSDVASWGSYTDTIHDDLRGSVQAAIDFFLGDSVLISPILGVDAKYSQIDAKVYSDLARTTLTDSGLPYRTDFGFWARAKVYIGEAWSADAGARLSLYRVAMGADGKAGQPLVYDAGISFVPGESWAFSARYGRVFRYPFLDEQASYQGFGPPPFNLTLRPEYGHNVTASAEFRSGNFRTSLSPYFIAMTDEIAYVFPTGNENIGSTYHYGGVASVSWTGDILEFEASYSFDRAQFTDTLNLVPLIPCHTVYGKVGVHPFKNVELSTDGRFSSAYYEGGDTTNSLAMIPGRFDWNLRVEWRPLNGEVSIYGQVLNLLDDRTPTAVYYGGWYPSAGRVVEIGASWSH